LDDGAGDFEIAVQRSPPSALPSPVTTVALMLGAGFAALGSLMSSCVWPWCRTDMTAMRGHMPTQHRPVNFHPACKRIFLI
jgi:hypothetical protein